MRRLAAKLHSQRGASMVIALMFFLVCLMIGAVMLVSATANTGRLSHLRTQEQRYLYVSSAARFLRDDMQNITYTIEETRLNNGAPAVAYRPTDSDFADKLYLADTLRLLAQDTYNHKSLGANARDITLRIDDTDVRATLAMTKWGDEETPQSEAFALNILVQDDTGLNSIRLHIPASVDISEVTSRAGADITAVKTIALTWETGSITRLQEVDRP